MDRRVPTVGERRRKASKSFARASGDHQRAWPLSSTKSWRRLALGLTAVLVGAGTMTSGAGTASASFGSETVIVTGSGSLSPTSAVLQVGGSVLTHYTIINGVLASVPVASEPVLAALPGIVVTPDEEVSLQADTATPPRQPAAVFPQQTGADQLATAGNTGQGISVAVLDTGISSLPDLAGRLLGGVDLTNDNDPFQDRYGHGTFVAGLIAGNGASSGGQYAGEATGANLVSVKVAGVSGKSDLGTLISGLQWAVNNRAQYNIKVLNISLGYQPKGSTVTNPLDQAVERAWQSGITVVASAGNAGPFNGTILSPGDDPLVITVAALDDLGQVSVSNDTMTAFSSVGPTSTDGWVKPDLVISGRSVVSLAAPGSTIYNNNPSARIAAANFVGSGTSFSSAITSGAAALVIAQNPGITPNQVKARLLGTATPGPVGDPFVDGHGVLNAYAAATSPALDYQQSAASLGPTQSGSTVSLANTCAVCTWNPDLWVGTAWNGTAWNGTAWNGTAWNGTAWNGTAWNGTAWNGTAWNGAQWNGTAWNGTAWNGTAWNGTAWNGTAWNGTAWNGSERN